MIINVVTAALVEDEDGRWSVRFTLSDDSTCQIDQDIDPAQFDRTIEIVQTFNGHPIGTYEVPVYHEKR